jgi:EAL domain-containing protein (putative c-di-GMP-specific phosphodiesterase class I)/GGDEF domain-containing protein
MHNRAAFSSLVETCIATDSHDSVAAVLYIEPDGFQALQAELSASTMDAFIANFAKVVQNNLDDQDTAGRISEGGLGILVHRPSVADIETLAQHLLKACRSHIMEIDDRAFSISCSIGISNIGRLTTDAGEVITHARQVQGEAAANGDSFEVYRPQLTAVETLDGEQGWVDRINHALGNQDFYTVQQSIVDLDGEGDQFMENITFMHSEDGDQPGSEFMLFAERNDLAGAIDRAVIPGLLKTLVDSSERQIINLSINSILDYSFPGWFAEQMKETCIEAQRIVLQISSAAALNNLRPAQRLMKELKPLGCRLSICHFDAERRTLQLLEHLDASFVKLDHALTVDLISDTKKQDAIRRIVDTANESGVAVIADEVADTSSLAVLWQCGVKLIAGAFLSESSQVIAQ